jgi:hypothetical protein
MLGVWNDPAHKPFIKESRRARQFAILTLPAWLTPELKN